MESIVAFVLDIYRALPSPHILFVIAGIAIIGLLLLYFWAWYSWPRFQVPIHLSPQELKNLEVQDQLRRTQIQIPIVVALVATFVLVLVQFGINSRQWTTDFELRNEQAQMNQLTDAVGALSQKSVEGHVAGIYALQYLIGLDVDRNIRRVNEMLTAMVRSHTTEQTLRHSVECNGKGDGWPQDREEASEDVQAALNVIGNRLYARYFDRHYDPRQKTCIRKTENLERLTYLARRPILEHRFLDNLNLAETDLSCSKFSGSRIRRTSFEKADLRGADFEAAIFENSDFLGLKEAVDEFRLKNPGGDAATWIHTAPENDWKRYRCWSTFFKDAALDGADFKSAHLSGAVFEGASLIDTSFEYANITLANFQGAKGLTKAQLEKACVWDNGQPLLDDDLKKQIPVIPACQWDGK